MGPPRTMYGCVPKKRKFILGTRACSCTGTSGSFAARAGAKAKPFAPTVIADNAGPSALSEGYPLESWSGDSAEGTDHDRAGGSA